MDTRPPSHTTVSQPSSLRRMSSHVMVPVTTSATVAAMAVVGAPGALCTRDTHDDERPVAQQWCSGRAGGGAVPIDVASKCDHSDVIHKIRQEHKIPTSVHSRRVVRPML